MADALSNEHELTQLEDGEIFSEIPAFPLTPHPVSVDIHDEPTVKDVDIESVRISVEESERLISDAIKDKINCKESTINTTNVQSQDGPSSKSSMITPVQAEHLERSLVHTSEVENDILMPSKLYNISNEIIFSKSLVLPPVVVLQYVSPSCSTLQQEVSWFLPVHLKDLLTTTCQIEKAYWQKATSTLLIFEDSLAGLIAAHSLSQDFECRNCGRHSFEKLQSSTFVQGANTYGYLASLEDMQIYDANRKWIKGWRSVDMTASHDAPTSEPANSEGETTANSTLEEQLKLKSNLLERVQKEKDCMMKNNLAIVLRLHEKIRAQQKMHDTEKKRALEIENENYHKFEDLADRVEDYETRISEKDKLIAEQGVEIHQLKSTGKEMESEHKDSLAKTKVPVEMKDRVCSRVEMYLQELVVQKDATIELSVSNFENKLKEKELAIQTKDSQLAALRAEIERTVAAKETKLAEEIEKMRLRHESETAEQRKRYEIKLKWSTKQQADTVLGTQNKLDAVESRHAEVVKALKAELASEREKHIETRKEKEVLEKNFTDATKEMTTLRDCKNRIDELNLLQKQNRIDFMESQHTEVEKALKAELASEREKHSETRKEKEVLEKNFTDAKKEMTTLRDFYETVVGAQVDRIQSLQSEQQTDAVLEWQNKLDTVEIQHTEVEKALKAELASEREKNGEMRKEKELLEKNFTDVETAITSLCDFFGSKISAQNKRIQSLELELSNVVISKDEIIGSKSVQIENLQVDKKALEDELAQKCMTIQTCKNQISFWFRSSHERVSESQSQIKTVEVGTQTDRKDFDDKEAGNEKREEEDGVEEECGDGEMVWNSPENEYHASSPGVGHPSMERISVLCEEFIGIHQAEMAKLELQISSNKLSASLKNADFGSVFLSNNPLWRCQLCEVSCGCQKNLNQHAQGAKHKRRLMEFLQALSEGQHVKTTWLNHLDLVCDHFASLKKECEKSIRSVIEEHADCKRRLSCSLEEAKHLDNQLKMVVVSDDDSGMLEAVEELKSKLYASEAKSHERKSRLQKLDAKLHNLEKQFFKSEKQRRDYRTRYEAAATTLQSIKSGLSDVVSKLGCSSEMPSVAKEGEEDTSHLGFEDPMNVEFALLKDLEVVQKRVEEIVREFAKLEKEKRQMAGKVKDAELSKQLFDSKHSKLKADIGYLERKNVMLEDEKEEAERKVALLQDNLEFHQTISGQLATESQGLKQAMIQAKEVAKGAMEHEFIPCKNVGEMDFESVKKIYETMHGVKIQAKPKTKAEDESGKSFAKVLTSFNDKLRDNSWTPFLYESIDGVTTSTPRDESKRIIDFGDPYLQYVKANYCEEMAKLLAKERSILEDRNSSGQYAESVPWHEDDERPLTVAEIMKLLLEGLVQRSKKRKRVC